jgi:hypothetical protein
MALFVRRLPFSAHAARMSMPAVQHGPIVEFIERHDTLRMIMEWLADRFAETEEGDTSIAWEDGEEHEDEDGPAAAA